MMILYVFAWILLAFFLLLILIILTPIRYDLRGYVQEKFHGDVKIGIGLLDFLIKWAAGGNNTFTLRAAGLALLKKPLSIWKKTERKSKEPPPSKKEPGGNLRDMTNFLDKGFLKSVLRVIRDVFHHSSPQVMELKGVWGFSDPYDTGLLAAAQAVISEVIPGIQVEPDFTREVRDLNVLVKGRIRPAILLFYGVRFIVSPPGRPVMKKLWQKGKNKK
jgi:hypothetical protein